MSNKEKKYPFNYYYYNRIAQIESILKKILGKLKLIKRNNIQNQYLLYYRDFLRAINDCCEFLNMDINKFIFYFEEKENLINKLWSESTPVDFYKKITGETGKSNICANSIDQFDRKFVYDALHFILNNYFNNNDLKLCDYGCGNAEISFSLVLNERITYLTMYDVYNESTKYIKYRIKKYNLDKKTIWKDVDSSVESISYYDIIMCIDVLEHLKNPSEVLIDRIYPMLKKEGFFILTAPWGGGKSHLDEAIYDFYRNGGRYFLKNMFKKVISMQSTDISGVWKKIK